MARLRNSETPATPHLITAVVQGRQRVFTLPDCANAVCASLQFLRRQGRIDLHAYVVMPDHIHFVATVRPEHRLDAVIRSFKSFTAHEIVGILRKAGQSRWHTTSALAAVRDTDQAFRVWQKGTWRAPLDGTAPLWGAIEYVHDNPVRARLVDEPAAWNWSSARAYEESEAARVIDVPDCWLGRRRKPGL